MEHACIRGPHGDFFLRIFMGSGLSSERSKEPINSTHRLHKFLHKRLKIPQELLQPFLSATRIVGHPAEYLLRKRWAKEILTDGSQRIQVPQKSGYQFFSADEIPDIPEIVQYCTEIFEQSRRNLPPDYFQNNPKKKYFNVLLEGDGFLQTS